MKYYLIAGEASGDLHASHLMSAILQEDPKAQFRYFGGDSMQKVGGDLVQHYKHIAYMGFIPVLRHFRVILKSLNRCKRDIILWKPDVVILVDYPGFNIKIAKFIHSHTNIPTFYYISPKIWAWKEYRIKNIKRDVNQLFSILPFEIPFYEEKHHFPIHYVGNPTMDEITLFKNKYTETEEEFKKRNSLDERPIVAILAGSRKQEIKDNLKYMIETAEQNKNMQFIIAGSPSIDSSYYNSFLLGKTTKIIYGQTYELLSHSQAALVTSGTATLETALFNVPQIVCYGLHYPSFMLSILRRMIKVKHVSLVNLIAGKEVVREYLGKDVTTANLHKELNLILNDESHRSQIIHGYSLLTQKIGEAGAPKRAAKIMVELLKK